MELTERWILDHGFKVSELWKEIGERRYMLHTDKGSINIMKSAVHGKRWLVDIRSNGTRTCSDHINTVAELNELTRFSKMDKICDD